jgi:hypothetical protein
MQIRRWQMHCDAGDSEAHVAHISARLHLAQNAAYLTCSACFVQRLRLLRWRNASLLNL